ncbi:hypothetical protein ASPWEDRAFT_37749 [Aspergillus wentii DTO 134E9]|uniref:Uncharacterized protein n=1 Tax=Aspergillus wentii DTO 134E9 TaxID=1073089 RepID=A0A1L9RYA6_ASPWE|nr:uncharacterized protein ASPWEDRAFT_37749 [Aspergillus wentii DTO 134E9]OJJ39883.1 hypothetical protein ASPWEDRAFT_37749 [Aspergillus wentii DTO 134E9]
MSLSPDVRENYIQVIDSILGKSDLNTISEKRIRKGLQEEVGYDLTPQKAAIKQLIMERFDIFAEQGGLASPEAASSTAPTTNGHEQSKNSTTPVDASSPAQDSSPQKRQADSEELSEPSNKTPPVKKRKQANVDVDADAVFAAKLQAEENMRARPTRGTNTRRAAPAKKKTTKTKTSKKVKTEDDSDLESGSEGTKKEVNRTGAFHKPLNLSPALSALLDGEATMSRPQTVKRVWQYIREHDLQDPSDRRQIRCDDAMRAVFKQDRVHMFTMTKILNQNLYSPDE